MPNTTSIAAVARFFGRLRGPGAANIKARIERHAMKRALPTLIYQLDRVARSATELAAATDELSTAVRACNEAYRTAQEKS